MSKSRSSTLVFQNYSKITIYYCDYISTAIPNTHFIWNCYQIFFFLSNIIDLNFVFGFMIKHIFDEFAFIFWVDHRQAWAYNHVNRHFNWPRMGQQHVPWINWISKTCHSPFFIMWWVWCGSGGTAARLIFLSNLRPTNYGVMIGSCWPLSPN